MVFIVTTFVVDDHRNYQYQIEQETMNTWIIKEIFLYSDICGTAFLCSAKPLQLPFASK